jgi:lipocalin-like protein
MSFGWVNEAILEVCCFSWEDSMIRLFALAVAVYCYVAPGLALAQDTSRQLVGSWKLTSWTIQIIGGDITEPFGRNPKGRALITPDGYAAFIIAAANRKPATNDAESAALLKTLLTYTGPFIIENDKFTTKVDISWNEILTGQDQVRFFKLEGDKLTIRTPEQASAVYPGKKVIGTLTWERER